MKTLMSVCARSVVLLILILFLPNAWASGVIICNNCANPSAAAKSSGIGTKIVADFSKSAAYGYSVEYDQEFGKWRVFSVPLPAEVRSAYSRIMSMTAASGTVITLRPGQDSNGMKLSSSFNDANAYDIVGSASLRTLLGQNLAANYTGATTSSSTWNDLTTSLHALALSFMGNKIGVEQVTFVILWKDGSRTVYKITPETMYEAKYVAGESVDAEGNKIPDASIASSSGGPSYGGQYYFGHRDNLQQWVNSAWMYGIPVTGGQTNRLTCTWDGRTLRCYYF